jgi:hypothetical protein
VFSGVNTKETFFYYFRFIYICDMENKVSALIFKTNGEMVDVEYNDPIELLEIQHTLGGYIEAIFILPEGKVMLVNKDGKGKDLEPNLNATAYLKATMDFDNATAYLKATTDFDDVIVGDAILLESKDFKLVMQFL